MLAENRVNDAFDQNKQCIKLLTMLKRTIYIGNPAYLRLKDNQLKVIDPDIQQEKGSVPIEDIAILMMDHFQITVSHQLLVRLQENNVAVVSCDAQHLPFSIMLPIAGHVEHSERLKHQINVSEPLRKQLWKQTVESKISQQLLALKKLRKPYLPMEKYMHDVKSGDSTNMEGIAAQFYWKHIFEDFSRDRDGETPNNLLNFGYAVLRSIVARALVSSGLNTTIGIFHRNKYNAFCLADDMMEPYRPYVDMMVYELMLEYPEEDFLTKEIKSQLLQISTTDVYIMQKMRPLMVAVSSTTSSLYKCMTGEQRIIHYPTIM